MWNLLLLCVAPAAQELPAELPLVCDQLARRALRLEGVPGLSIAVAQGETLGFARAYGLADPVAGLRMETDTRLPLGSLERPLLASLALSAVAEKRLSLDAPLSQCLRGAPEAWAAITLEQLLNGTSGLPSTSDLVGALAARERAQALDRPSFLEFAGGLPLAFTPGTRHVHDTIAWRLLPWILSDAFGEPLEKLLATQLYSVADLEHTGACPEALRPVGYARDCRDLDTGRERQLFAASEPLEVRAGLCSTPADVLRWWAAVRSDRIPARRLLESGRFLDGQRTGHGMGLAIERLASEPRWVHDGGISGFRASLGASASGEVAVCVMATCASAGTGDIEEEIERFCAGLPPKSDLALPVDAARAADWIGDYLLGTTRIKLFLRDDKLVYMSPAEELELSSQGLGRFTAGELELVMQPQSGRAEGFSERRKGAESRARRQ
jgi:CubicO group peptidase (beta-lactamase class C family)